MRTQVRGLHSRWRNIYQLPIRPLGIYGLVIGCFVGVVRADDEGTTCTACHKTQIRELLGSVHATLSCQECHGGSKSYEVSADAIAVYSRGEEGSRSPFDHGEEFLGKPTRKQIPERCGSCHADVARMNPFGLRTDQLSRYKTSGHGTTLEKTGDDRVAVCVDCHGVHDVLPHNEPASKTYALNIPDTCSSCHADEALMSDFDIASHIVDEYRNSVHGKLLFEQGDTGAPTCATCHGNHAAMPPGFGSVGDVCGKCHVDARDAMATTAHAEQEEFRGCIQCHAADEGGHHHLIKRVTQPIGLLVDRFAALDALQDSPKDADALAQIFSGPRRLLDDAMHGCLECHEEIDEDESLQSLLTIFESIVEGERAFAKTARRLENASKGVLLVDDQLFLFEDAKTQLIGLASAQHTLNEETLTEKAAELKDICAKVDLQLDELDAGLARRRAALVPIWVFSVLFAIALYAKYKQLKHLHVKA